MKQLFKQISYIIINKLKNKQTKTTQYLLNKNIINAFQKPHRMFFELKNYQENFSLQSKDKNVLLLPLPRKILKIVDHSSGLMVPRSNFYTHCVEDFCKIFVKFILNLYYKDLIYANNETLAMHFKNLLNYAVCLELKNDYYYPIMQHICTSMLYYYEFSPQLLEKITKGLINYAEFSSKFIGPLPILEAWVFHLTCNNFMENNKDKINIYAQNHEKDNGKHLLYKNEAYKLTRQPCPDWRVEFLYFDGTLLKNFKRVFLDSKLKLCPIENVPLMKGCISITTKFDENKFMQKFLGDLNSNIQNKILSLKEKYILKSYSQNLKEVYEDKSLASKVKFIKFTGIIQDIRLNCDVISIFPSIFIQAINDDNFSTLYEKEIKTTFNFKEVEKIISKDIYKLFPKDGQSIDIVAWKTAFNTIVKYLPKDMQKTLLDNHARWDLSID